MADEPLDNPVWHALTGPQAHMAEVAGAARRYPPAVAFFAAVDRLDDGRDGDGGDNRWAALAHLAGPGGEVVLTRDRVPAPPAGWRETLRLQGVQMTFAGESAALAERRRALPDGAVVRPLTVDDVPAMLDLTGLTRPGPFFADTIRFGGYIGVEQRGRLVAMAGRRLDLGELVEISAVCVHPDAAGAGLGAAVTALVAESILAEGAQPLLHVAVDNAKARQLYARLGFSVRRTVDFVRMRAPAG